MLFFSGSVRALNADGVDLTRMAMLFTSTLQNPRAIPFNADNKGEDRHCASLLLVIQAALFVQICRLCTPAVRFFSSTLLILSACVRLGPFGVFCNSPLAL